MLTYISRDISGDQVRLWRGHLKPIWCPVGKKFLSSSFGSSLANAGPYGQSSTICALVDEYDLKPGQLVDARTGEVVEDHSVTPFEDLPPGVYKLKNSGVNFTHIIKNGAGDKHVAVLTRGGVRLVANVHGHSSDTLELVKDNS